VFEEHVQFLKWDSKAMCSVPVPLSDRLCRVLIKNCQPGELPELRGVVSYPPLVQRDGTLVVAGKGYVRETGWFNASDAELPIIGLDEAVEKFKWLYREYDWATAGDRSRGLVYPIGVALKLAGLIKGPLPVDFGTANDSQAGKGTRQQMTARFFNEVMATIPQSESHIGGTWEMFKSACRSGSKFVQLDNFTRFSSVQLEAFLTAKKMRGRAAFEKAGDISPANHVVFITSNGLVATRDSANRFWFIRILKKADDYLFHQYSEGDLLAHIAFNWRDYLAFIYAICRAWFEQGCQRTSEHRHNFRDFTQVCDWIAQNILKEAPVMDGHPEAVKLFSDAGRVLFLRLWDGLQRQGQLNRAFRAGQLATMAFRFRIQLPGLSEERATDETAGAKLVGAIAAGVFGDESSMDLGQSKRIERTRDWALASDDDDSKPPYRLPRGEPGWLYIFSLDGSAPQKSASAEASATKAPAPQAEKKDAVEVFRNDLLAALAERGYLRGQPAEISTSSLTDVFKCSPEQLGKWLHKLASRYPENVQKADTKVAKGWTIHFD
jgi:hypothetical protein